MTNKPTQVVLAVVSSLLISALGCSDDEPTTGRAERPTEASSSLYAIMYEVFDDVGSNSYLSLVSSIEEDEIDSSSSREFAGGRAYLRSYEGWIFVGEPETPTVRRFSVSAKGELEEDGEVSFARFGLESGEIDAWTTTFISKTKAYTFHFAEGTTIVWNPTTMEVTGEIEPPDGLVRADYRLEGSPAALRGDKLFRMFDWVTKDGVSLQEQRFAVYDVENDELLEIRDEPRCNAMGNLVHEDEDGAFYFSNWIWSISDVLLAGGQKNCVLRVGPDSDALDPDFELTFADLAEGREGAMFTYLGDQTGLFSAFYAEDVEYDETVGPYELAGNPAWHIWKVDLESREAAPFEGIGVNTGAYTPVRVEDRTFLMVPGADWAETNIYEIEEDGAKPTMSVPGWTYQFAKVR